LETECYTLQLRNKNSSFPSVVLKGETVRKIPVSEGNPNMSNQSATVPAILAPAIAALASQPVRATFEETALGKKLAGLLSDEETAPIYRNAKQKWESDNLANPFEDLEIAVAHMLASSVPPASLGTVSESIRARFFALSGLRNVTDKEISNALQEGKGDVFDLLAQIFARAKFAKETVSNAEAVRLAKLSPNSYGAVNKWMSAGVQIERKDAEGKAVAVSVDSLLLPAARKWAKANSVTLAKG
jgi:hypothetical protein